jgi:LysR family hydrogen peroxide-inducible transcriptional activator
METHEIRYFLAMVRELNFTRAAAACGITQPALTRAIKKLESELGGALFLRRPGHIEPTRLARELLPRLEAIEQGMVAVRAHAATVAESQTNSLRLGVMCTVGPAHIVALLSKLQLSMPDVEISIVDAKAGQIVDLLIADDIDVGITAWPTYPESVHAERLISERYVIAARHDSTLAAEAEIPLALLCQHNYIERLGCEFDDYYEARHGKWTVELNVTFSSEREDWIQGLLLAGLGCAIVPERMELAEGIVKRPLTAPDVTREISMVTLRGKQLPRAAAAFARIAKSHRWQEPR